MVDSSDAICGNFSRIMTIIHELVSRAKSVGGVMNEATFALVIVRTGPTQMAMRGHRGTGDPTVGAAVQTARLVSASGRPTSCATM